MVIDAHTHVERKSDRMLYTPEEFVKAMDMGGVDISIVFGNDQGDMGKILGTEFRDEEVAEFCSKFPKRLIGITSINPYCYRAKDKIRRAVEKLKLRGVKLYPHSGFYVNDKRLYPIYDYCQTVEIPVIIHTGIKAVRQQYMKYNSPIYADDVATDFPELNIIMCHGGYPWVEEFFAVAGTNPNIYVDISFLDYIEQKFVNPGLTENTLRRLNSIIGSKRLIWGSEGPFMELPLYGSHGPDNYKKSMDFLVRRFEFLTEEDKKNILGKNAERLFIKKGEK